MFANAADIERFALAGRAILTMESERTGSHYTYKISAAPNGGVHFVGVLTNGNEYVYAGIITGREKEFRLTVKSKFSADAPCVRAFNWVWNAVRADRMPADCKVHHEGTCGRCGLPLTVPASIERGIGPECAKLMGMAPEPRRRRQEPAKVITLADRRPPP
jgi:hypothetical protein